MTVLKNYFLLTDEEKEAVERAKEIIATRFAKAGYEFSEQFQNAVKYSLYGALYTGGIDGMMRYAKQTPIKKKEEKA